MFNGYKIKYITYGWDKDHLKVYGVLMIKLDRGWAVEVWPCNTYGFQASDPIEWNDGLTWWNARKLFYKWYAEYDQYVNSCVQWVV